MDSRRSHLDEAAGADILRRQGTQVCINSADHFFAHLLPPSLQPSCARKKFASTSSCIDHSLPRFAHLALEWGLRKVTSPISRFSCVLFLSVPGSLDYERPVPLSLLHLQSRGTVAGITLAEAVLRGREP